jgi:hypothetical protein
VKVPSEQAILRAEHEWRCVHQVRPWSWCKRGLKKEGNANLPAGLEREAGDCHAVDGAARARGHARRIMIAVAARAGLVAPGKLNDEPLAHELGAI